MNWQWPGFRERGTVMRSVWLIFMEFFLPLREILSKNDIYDYNRYS